MNREEQQAILTISLMAAFADGRKEELERAELKRITESLSGADLNAAALYQDVLLKRLTLDDVARVITAPEVRQYAYEMAVCVCDADGAHSPAEKTFLDRLRVALGLDAVRSETFAAEAAKVASVPLDAGSALEPAPATTPAQAEMDPMILNYAVLNGALELLPQNLASMAIIPLQMKMVYRIGKAHGYELDRGHIKDFLATLGVGLTSQYLEQFGRKLIGGLLGKIAGGIGRGIGGAATGSAFSFATTYALGQVAKRYYAGGRTLSGETLKETFSAMLGEAKSLQSRYLPQIEEKARTLDVNQVLQAARQ